MDYNIVDKYVNYIRDNFLKLFKIIFKSNYHKDLSLLFIDRYIEVRYFNETDYSKEKDFINRINKELIDLANEVYNDKNVEDVKNIVALFAYLIYFDDIGVTTQEMDIIDMIIEDGVIKISNTEGLSTELRNWYIELQKGKDTFNNTLITKNFNLVEKRLYRKVYSVVLEHNVKISNLYSDYAVEKAYNGGVINEDKLFITYILVANQILNNAINLDFSRFYAVPLANTLYDKPKKINRLLNSIDNELTKKYIYLRITYQDYKKHDTFIDELISKGYSFCLELDSTYTGDINELFLFPYILVYADSEEYEMLMREKENIKSRIVKL